MYKNPFNFRVFPDKTSLTVSKYASLFNQLSNRQNIQSFHQIKPIKLICARKDEIPFLSIGYPRLR
jgi:hypothetical protein